MLQVKVVGPEGKDATKTMLQRVRKRREGVPQPFPFEGCMTFQPLKFFQPRYFNPRSFKLKLQNWTFQPHRVEKIMVQSTRWVALKVILFVFCQSLGPPGSRWNLFGVFQVEFVGISWVINHMTCYKFEFSHWWKIYQSKIYCKICSPFWIL